MIKNRAKIKMIAAATPTPMPAFAPVPSPWDICATLVVDAVGDGVVDVCDTAELVMTVTRLADSALCVVAAAMLLALVDVGSKVVDDAELLVTQKSSPLSPLSLSPYSVSFR